MNIWTQPGTKVRFSYPDNGWDGEKIFAAERLIVGAEYTVKIVNVNNWSSSVEFEEVEGKFNVVQFEDIEEMSEEDKAYHSRVWKKANYC